MTLAFYLTKSPERYIVRGWITTLLRYDRNAGFAGMAQWMASHVRNIPEIFNSNKVML